MWLINWAIREGNAAVATLQRPVIATPSPTDSAEKHLWNGNKKSRIGFYIPGEIKLIAVKSMEDAKEKKLLLLTSASLRQKFRPFRFQVRPFGASSLFKVQAYIVWSTVGIFSIKNSSPNFWLGAMDHASSRGA